jgi:hypothetical protein
MDCLEASGPIIFAMSCKLLAMGNLTASYLYLSSFSNSFFIYGHFCFPTVCKTPGKK